MFRTLKVGIIVNHQKPGALRTLRDLRAALEGRGISYVFEESTARLAGESGGIPAAEFADRVDMAAVLGGDGTMLNAVLRLGRFEKPVAGINIGTLGFLTSCTDGELDAFARAIESGGYTTSRRTLLEATVFRSGRAAETYFALNEITLARGETGRLVSLRVSLNGDLLNHYRADGLIVASPTGSTAYSLSAGGPLIEPSAAVFVITPICPHSLSQRSLITSDDSVIELSPDNPADGPMLFTADGRDNSRVEQADSIRVKKADRCFHLLRFGDMSFYEALRQKLRWQGL